MLVIETTDKFADALWSLGFAGKPFSIKEISDKVTDIPQSTLYRRIDGLEKLQIITICNSQRRHILYTLDTGKFQDKFGRVIRHV